MGVAFDEQEARRCAKMTLFWLRFCHFQYARRKMERPGTSGNIGRVGEVDSVIGTHPLPILTAMPVWSAKCATRGKIISMKRGIVNFLTVVSLVVCLASTIFEVRSYLVRDCLWRLDAEMSPRIYSDDWIISSYRGELLMIKMHREWNGIFAGTIFTGHRFIWDPFPSVYYQTSSIPIDPSIRSIIDYEFMGVRFVHWREINEDYPENHSSLTLPLPLLILISMVLPAIRIRSIWRKRKKVQEGHCRSCGYDLRATPERCPECGTAVKMVVT